VIVAAISELEENVFVETRLGGFGTDGRRTADGADILVLESRILTLVVFICFLVGRIERCVA